MIAELIHVADNWPSGPLTGQEPSRRRSVHWFIDLDINGNVIGFSPTAGQNENRAKKFDLPFNYSLGSSNQFSWLPDFLSGPPNEIFPNGVSGTNTESNRGKQNKWRELVLQAEKEIPGNVALGAVAKFVKRDPRFDELPLPRLSDDDRKTLLKAFDEGKATFSFRVNGQLVFRDSTVRDWWRSQVQKQRQTVVDRLRLGQDAFLPGIGPLTDSSPAVFGNVPLASFDKAPFRSYGLGEQTVTFRLETAERASAALNALAQEQACRISLEQIGKKELFAVFWAVQRLTGEQIAADFMQLLDQPDPLAVQDYLKGIWGTHPPEIETADFYVAILLKGTGRFSVRSWHTDTLGNADRHVRRYFQAITLADEQEQRPALRDLASATIAKSKETKPPPATYNALFEAAWRGTPLPFDLLAATIERQRVELAKGFDAKTESDFNARLAARIALVQLYFALKNRNDHIPNWPEHVMNTKETALLCGRLLALLDKIHDAAHDGKSASSPANRLYGAASATPALVFPRLCQLARYHLQKMDAGLAHKLEFGVPKDRRDDGVPQDFEGLAAIVARLKEASGGEFPRTLSLEEQGRFALGFYYERTRQWPNYKSTQPETEND